MNALEKKLKTNTYLSPHQISVLMLCVWFPMCTMYLWNVYTEHFVDVNSEEPLTNKVKDKDIQHPKSNTGK